MSKKLEKGMILGDDWFYVVVEWVLEGSVYARCICDNANNTYCFSLDEILDDNFLILSPKEAVSIQSYGGRYNLSEEDHTKLNKIDRPIPLDVMAEVLAGQHDRRFE